MDYSKKILSPDVLEKIRHIELQTKRLLRGTVSGLTVASRRGYGLEFDQLRDYEPGDDVRFIDWKSSVRSNNLMVKQHLHEYTPTIFIALDISASTVFGSSEKSIGEGLQEAALVLMLAAFHIRAAVSLILFDESVVSYIPPLKGDRGRHALIETLIAKRSSLKKTKLTSALRHVIRLNRTDGMLFLLSDFIDDYYEKELAIVSRLFDTIVVRKLDPLLTSFPSLGLLYMQDSENEKVMLANTKSALDYCLQARLTSQNSLFASCKVDQLNLDPTLTIVDQVVHFFSRRLSTQGH